MTCCDDSLQKLINSLNRSYELLYDQVVVAIAYHVSMGPPLAESHRENYLAGAYKPLLPFATSISPQHTFTPNKRCSSKSGPFWQQQSW
jgi:hypothetical protein